MYNRGMRGTQPDVFRAVSDPTRRALLERLRSGERSVSELARPFRMSQPALSQHLRVLRAAGLVSRRRRGRFLLYRLEAGPLRQIHEWASRLHREAGP
jgi:DNA-binding transcriptional ArsR family regulator